MSQGRFDLHGYLGRGAPDASREFAQGLKVKPSKSGVAKVIQPRPIQSFGFPSGTPPRQTNVTSVQGDNERTNGDLFEGSVLSGDSDSTVQDLTGDLPEEWQPMVRAPSVLATRRGQVSQLNFAVGGRNQYMDMDGAPQAFTRHQAFVARSDFNEVHDDDNDMHDIDTVDPQTAMRGQLQFFEPEKHRVGDHMEGAIATPMTRRTGRFDSAIPGTNGRQSVSGRGISLEHDDDLTDEQDFSVDLHNTVARAADPSPARTQMPRTSQGAAEVNIAIPGAVTRKRTQEELDYSAEELQSMKYSQLDGEDFDHDPKLVAGAIPQELAESSLEELLTHFAAQPTEAQINLFKGIPIDKWEQSGDWFLDRFGDLITKFKEARKAKRETARMFEEELAAREAAVRAKTEETKENLDQMRAGGEVVLRGRVA